MEHEHHLHHHHHHHHHGAMSPEVKAKLVKIIVSTLALAGAVLLERLTGGVWEKWQYLLVYLIPYLIIGFDTLKEAAESLFHGEALSEDFLMSVATVGALVIGFVPGAETQFPEAVFVMLFFQVGELFEEMAEGRSRKSIAHLMRIRPDHANVLRDGRTLRVNPSDVKVGETIVI